MELSQLRYFVTVAQMQHLTKAAETLCISQPALSKAISRLEEELGVTLFDRASNRITLNQNGRLYLQFVQQALSLLDSGKDMLQSNSGLVSGSVSIMTSCSGILQPAIRKFLTEHRDIQYQQYRYTSDLIADQLEGGTADFAVTSTPLSSATFSWNSLLQDELYVVVPEGHRLHDRAEITLEELWEEPLIISNTLLTIHDIVVEGFAKHGLRPHIAYELNNPPLTEQLLEEHRGLTFSPGVKVEPAPEEADHPRRRIPVKGHPFTYELGILKLRGHVQRPVAGLLEQFLLSWFASPANKERTEADVGAL
jgi:DNA-binding transcriptional LysR family regulator